MVNTKARLKKLGIFSLAGMLVYLGASGVFYDKLTRIEPGYRSESGNTPMGWSHFPSHYEHTKAMYTMPGYRLVSIPGYVTQNRYVSDQFKLSGWWVEHPHNQKRAIIMVHGLRTSKASTTVLIPAGMLYKHGFSVLLIDLRNHGISDRDSGRTTIGFKEAWDIIAAQKWLTQKGYCFVGVYGISLGATSGLLAFAQDSEINAAFLDSGFSDLNRIIQSEVDLARAPRFIIPGGLLIAKLFGQDLMRIDPISVAKTIRDRPILIAHNINDNRIDFRHAQLLKDALKADNKAQFWFYSVRDHASGVFNIQAEYERRLVEFFKRV